MALIGKTRSSQAPKTLTSGVRGLKPRIWGFEPSVRGLKPRVWGLSKGAQTKSQGYKPMSQGAQSKSQGAETKRQTECTGSLYLQIFTQLNNEHPPFNLWIFNKLDFLKASTISCFLQDLGFCYIMAMSPEVSICLCQPSFQIMMSVIQSKTQCLQFADRCKYWHISP